MKENNAVKRLKTPEQFLEEFFSSSKRIKIKGDPVKWYKKLLDEQYEEEYAEILKGMGKKSEAKSK